MDTEIRTWFYSLNFGWVQFELHNNEVAAQITIAGILERGYYAARESWMGANGMRYYRTTSTGLFNGDERNFEPDWDYSKF
jgi:hypothetical protein